MASGVHHAVRARADQVAEGGEQLEKNGGGMGLSVRGQGADCEPGEAVEGGFAKPGAIGHTGRGGRSRVDLRLRWRLKLLLDAEQLGPSTLYIRECRQDGPGYSRDGVGYHDSTLVRFLIAVDGVSDFCWTLISHRSIGDYKWLYAYDWLSIRAWDLDLITGGTLSDYSSLSTCNGFWPSMRKLAAQPVAVASTAVPTRRSLSPATPRLTPIS